MSIWKSLLTQLDNDIKCKLKPIKNPSILIVKTLTWNAHSNSLLTQLDNDVTCILNPINNPSIEIMKTQTRNVRLNKFVNPTCQWRHMYVKANQKPLYCDIENSNLKCSFEQVC